MARNIVRTSLTLNGYTSSQRVSRRWNMSPATYVHRVILETLDAPAAGRLTLSCPAGY